MRLTTVILIASMMQLAAAGKAQRVSMNKTNASLKAIIKELRSQTGFDFVYKERLLQEFKPVTIKVENEELAEVLTEVFKGQPFAFEINSKTVIVKGKEESSFLDKVVDGVKSYLAYIDVSGKVVDETGQPIGGASVVIKSTGKGVSTTADGNFYLKNAEEGTTLVIKFIGYEPREIAAAKELGIVRMKVATNELDQVQIQAYGVTSKRLTTSNISTVRAEDIEKQPISNPLLALQGRVPGMIVTPSSGFAGSTVKVRIQGYNSINAGNNPFYVVDGVPFNSYNVLPSSFSTVLLAEIWGAPETIRDGRSQLSGESAGSPLNYINPSDIESIEILKDADATAIYGSKAANGAIIITTKKGKAGPMRIDASLRSGFDKVGSSLDFLNYERYIALRLEARRNNNEPILDTDYDLNGFWGTEETNRDYQKELLGKFASNHNAQLSISGGTGTTDYRVNLGYQFQNGVLGNRSNSGNESISLGLNLNTASIDRKFKLGLSLAGMLNDNRLPYNNPLGNIMALPPNSPTLYSLDGSINWALRPDGFSTWNNPMAEFERNTTSKTNNLNTNLTISYEILPNLKLLAMAGYNMMDIENKSRSPLTAIQPIERSPAFRQISLATSQAKNYIIEPQISFLRQIGQYKFDFLIGGTIQKTNNSGTSLSASGFPSDQQMDNLPIATSRNITGALSRIYRYNAAFAKFNINLIDEFLLNFTIRRDGSSRFGPANRFQNFAAVGTGWIFSERKWFKEKLPALSFGKLRVSYGITGNDQVGDYTYMNLYNTTTNNIPYQEMSTIVTNGLFNSNLQWESNHKLNFGIDLNFIKDKIEFNGNYAINRSKNLLQQRQYSTHLSVGTTAPTVYDNFPGQIQNTSLELMLTTSNIQRKNFSWRTIVSATHSTNTLKSFGDFNLLNGGVSAFSNLTVGQSILSRRVFLYSGVDPLTGQVRQLDRNGNPTLFPTYEEDNIHYIDLLPAYSGGISNIFTYRGINLDIFIQFQKQLQNRYGLSHYYGTSLQNEPEFVEQRWKNPGDISAIWRSGFAANSYADSDVRFEDASFIRLKNISISYNLPSSFTNKLKFRRITVLVQAQNLWTITKYSGLDPETGSSALPMPKTVVIGLNVGF